VGAARAGGETERRTGLTVVALKRSLAFHPCDLVCPTQAYTIAHARRLAPLEPQARPTVPPTAGEPLWSVRKGDVTWSAELRYHGEYGVEAQILRNGELVIGRRFVLKEQAVKWAEAEKPLVGDRLEWME
jgi:hypothetical protein